MRKPSATKKKREAKAAPARPTVRPSAPPSAPPPRATTPPGSNRDARKFRPPSSEAVPRFAGVPTFLRLPVYDDPRTVPAVDVLLCGVPFDGGTSFRPGARFGPRAVR